MTPTQKRVLDFVDATLRRTGGVAPSYREICHGAGVSCVSSVKLILDRLERDGHVIRKPGRARSVEVARRDNHCPHCGRPQ